MKRDERARELRLLRKRGPSVESRERLANAMEQMEWWARAKDGTILKGTKAQIMSQLEGIRDEATR